MESFEPGGVMPHNVFHGGFYDIALEPRLLDWPDIAHAALIELKYLKPGDPEPTPDALALPLLQQYAEGEAGTLVARRHAPHPSRAPARRRRLA